MEVRIPAMLIPRRVTRACAFSPPRGAGASRIPGGAGRITPPQGRAERLEEDGRSPRAAAVRAVASFLQLLLFWAKLEARGARRPSRPSAPAAVRSPRGATRRCRPAGPAPPCGDPRTHTSAAAAHAAATRGTLRPSPRPRGRSDGDPPAARLVPPGGPCREEGGAAACGEGGNHLQVRGEFLLLHQPRGRRDVAGARERRFAQLGRLFLRLLGHCGSRGCASVSPEPGRRAGGG